MNIKNGVLIFLFALIPLVIVLSLTFKQEITDNKPQSVRGASTNLQNKVTQQLNKADETEQVQGDSTTLQDQQPLFTEEQLTNLKDMNDKVTELKIEDTTVGDGAEVKSGDTVSVHYTGTLLDGTKFDSSKDRGQPFEFKVGEGLVIKGWDEGLVGMKVGGTRVLTIPADMAYGDNSPSPLIPAGSALKFEIDLLEVK